VQSRLIELLLRDGTIFYAVMAAANLLNFLLFLFEPFDFFETSAGNNSEITHAISVTLVSRMMLNLMEVASSSSATTGGDTRQEEVAQISCRFSAAAAVTHTFTASDTLPNEQG